jgi:hypothetical protein
MNMKNKLIALAFLSTVTISSAALAATTVSASSGIVGSSNAGWGAAYQALVTQYPGVKWVSTSCRKWRRSGYVCTATGTI